MDLLTVYYIVRIPFYTSILFARGLKNSYLVKDIFISKELIELFNIQNKYSSFGCYRFLDDEAKTIYIGKSKNIHRRLFSQHFKTNGSYGHLPIDCYKNTCKIEIIKCNDHAQTVALEQYLIDKYLPKYNDMDKRKDLFKPTKFDNEELYERLENWKLYYTFREYNFNKIKTSCRQNKLALIITFLFFICVLINAIKGLI